MPFPIGGPLEPISPSL